jgi:alpha-D-ribose 1-methylphosphonate 5-triphosphate synthase subunit PhnG
MSPEELVTGLAAAARVRRERLLSLAGAVTAENDVRVDQSPRPSSVMLELDSPVGDFSLGEVVVTTAGVTLGTAQGWACVMGYDDEGALAAALCAAAGGDRARLLARDARAEEAAAARREEEAAATTRIEP